MSNGQVELSTEEALRHAGAFDVHGPAVKKGKHDWSRQPRTMVDGPESDDSYGLAVLAVALGEVLLVAFLVVWVVCGALLLARGARDAIAAGWSFRVLLASIHDRLGPA